MRELLASALGLGLAGLDPAGVLIALAALAAGARPRTVVAFTLVTVLGTALLGTVLSLALGPRLATLDWVSLLPPDWLGAVLEIAAAAGLLAWAVVRWRRPGARPPRPERGRARSGGSLLLAGVLLAASAPLDPTLLGLVVLAGRGEPVVAVATAHLLWIVVSQLPLVVLAVAVVLRRHERVVARLRAALERARPVLRRLVTVALAGAGVLLLLDAGSWFTTGRFLVLDS